MNHKNTNDSIDIESFQTLKKHINQNDSNASAC